MALEIFQFPCLDDNYGYLIHDNLLDQTATIDTPDADAITLALDQKGWQLTHIFNTHHHSDHVDGNLELKDKANCKVVGSKRDQDRIPGIDICISDNEEFLFGEHRIIVQETSGHTIGHIVYHLVDQQIAFVGDTLFSLGCGRIFEGSPDQMWGSLQKIMQWPDDTKLYCSHEYTQSNSVFALSIEPENKQLQERVVEVNHLRAQGLATIPTTVRLEKATNPFLRPDSQEIQQNLKMLGKPSNQIFAKIRELKDSF